MSVVGQRPSSPLPTEVIFLRRDPTASPHAIDQLIVTLRIHRPTRTANGVSSGALAHRKPLLDDSWAHLKIPARATPYPHPLRRLNGSFQFAHPDL